jgi:thiol-disulfide isomerase/thioredoxin
MKINHLILLLLSFLWISCEGNQAKQEKYISVSISGHVSGFDKALTLYGPSLQESIKLDGNGNFSVSYDSIAEGRYGLGLGSETQLKLYLKKGTQLQLDIDLDKIEAREKNAVSISGMNNDETELMYELMVSAPSYQYDRASYKEVYLPMVDKKEPKAFEAYQLEMLEKERAIVEKYVDNKSISKTFLEVFNVEQLLNYNFKFQLYHRLANRRNPGKNWEVPSNFAAYFKNEIPQNDFDLYHKSSRYAMYVREAYHAKMREVLSKYERESMKYFKEQTAYLDTCTFPEIIKTDMYNGYTISYMRASDKDIRAYLESVIYKKVADKDALKRFEDFKAGENAYADGKPAPQFTLIDINGKEVSLSDFKGKMVMMDCWATWCAPCVKGLPKFNKLRDKYAGKNIVFLAISVDENVELWKRKVKENKSGIFQGIQLNTSINKNTFKDDLMVQGIPRYILVGADGLLIRREAPRPGTHELYELIDSNLK